MAVPTIAGVETGPWAYPLPDERERHVSIGQATDGSYKQLSLGPTNRVITITLKGKGSVMMASLGDALDADADGVASLAPETHIDLGGGAGVAVNAQWLDGKFVATPDNYESWSTVLHFVRIP